MKNAPDASQTKTPYRTSRHRVRKKQHRREPDVLPSEVRARKRGGCQDALHATRGESQIPGNAYRGPQGAYRGWRDARLLQDAHREPDASCFRRQKWPIGRRHVRDATQAPSRCVQDEVHGLELLSENAQCLHASGLPNGDDDH